MPAPRHDTAGQPLWPASEAEMATGPVRPTDVEALMSGHIDLLELTERAWVRCGLPGPGPRPALEPARV